MVLKDVLGFSAAILTTTAFIPQVIKIWKTKSTRDISLGMFSMFCLGVFIWLIYGFIIHALPVILANAIIFILASIILIFKIKYK